MLQMSQGCGKPKDKIKEYVLARECINKFLGGSHINAWHWLVGVVLLWCLIIRFRACSGTNHTSILINT
jgi:hypothetical protein